MPLRSRRPPLGVAITLALALGASEALAQARPDPAATTGGSARTTLLRGGEMGELLSVYVPRNESEIQRLLGDSRDAEGSVMEDIERTRKLAQDADGRARIMKEELEATRVRRDVARRAKDAAAAAELEKAFLRQDREQIYLEDLRDALRADIDRLTAEREAAASRTTALELELRVVQRNRELTGPPVKAERAASTPAPPPPSPEALSHYRGLLRDMLEAQRSAAGRWATAAERRRLLAERKIRQLDALTRLSAPPTTTRR